MPGFELFSDEERKSVEEVLKEGVLMRYNFEDKRNNVWKAKELEQEIKEFTTAGKVQLTSSGTAALITALAALGVGAGDEVIVPTFTFVATFEAIVALGAIPILVNIDDTLCLNPDSIKRCITPQTKAVMPVHMCGGMADMDEIMQIANEHNLLVIEDACQSIGASFNGSYLGTIGHAGTFSFDYVKTVTCGEGGAVMVNDKKYFDKIEQFTDHGHTHEGSDRGAESHPFLGTNFRISELNAAVGLAQWKKLNTILQIQRKNKSILKAQLEKINQVEFRSIPDENGDNASFLSIFLPNEMVARKAQEKLKIAGVIPSFYWYDNGWHYIRNWEHLKDIATMYPLYNEQREMMPNYDNQDFSPSDHIMSRTLSFQISVKTTEDEMIENAIKIKEVLEDVISNA